ncbi:MAG TPA: M23 family metallopeptidase [Anaeromyxobacteraceae bacterium]|nr:M23 family metallopeptidase [Anaeromyxobacteraceae bacterium]
MVRRIDDVPRRGRAPAVLAGLCFLTILGVALAGAAGRLRAAEAPVAAAPPPAAADTAVPPGAATMAAAPPAQRFKTVTIKLQRNQTVSQALMRLNLSADEVKGVIGALRDHFPFRKARPGDQLRLERREGSEEVHRFSYRQGIADEWIVERGPNGTLEGRKRPVELTTEVARVAVTIESSLYDTLEKSGEDPDLAVLASDVLAWDVDFYQDVRAGDAMRIVVEKVFADGKLLRYGEVLAAEYDGAATGRKRLFRYTDPDGHTSYYDDDGNSAQRGFLKSPLKYAHVTSKFGGRRHPVLGYYKQHQGVDYGAPTGTPVWAVGDAQVKVAGWHGACGKTVILRHRNGLESIYCHLSKVAVSSGKPVSQKQVVGYVGTTGRSTGPHLHFAVKKNGSYVNPLSLKVPRAAPIPAKWKADFVEKIAPLRTKLDAEAVALN